MSRPRILDLFCGAGGMAKGYHDAGFEVVGVDLHPQPHYPYTFIQNDVMSTTIAQLMRKGGFVAFHASPPCQGYSLLRFRLAQTYPLLINSVRDLLKKFGKPYVIENVEAAPLIDPVTLCGAMDIFPDLRVLRHRKFETSFDLPQPAHPKKHPLVVTMDGRKAHAGKLDPWKDYVGVHGGGQGAPVAACREAMGIDWMTKAELNQAIPPVYAEYIGKYLMKEVA